jgi:hypothetical protein
MTSVLAAFFKLLQLLHGVAPAKKVVIFYGINLKNIIKHTYGDICTCYGGHIAYIHNTAGGGTRIRRIRPSQTPRTNDDACRIPSATRVLHRMDSLMIYFAIYTM